MIEPIIRELSPQLLEDWLHFFDHDAVTANPHWASCYCYFYLADHRAKPWKERTADENRT